MKFNAKKCNIMRVSRSRKPLQHFYSLGNEILQEVSDAKYLGIQIDNKLDWNKHISTFAARGQSKLAFLNRNLKGCPKKLRDTAYISLIRPALEYSCSVWHPHKKSNKDKIEKVQRRAARFVSNNFRRKASISEMLHELGWQSLDGRRQDQRLVLFFKIINGLASVSNFRYTLSSSGMSNSTSSNISNSQIKKSQSCRTLVININSAPGKRAELENLINYTDPDLIIMTETKIDEQVKASEFLPKGYTGDIRKDRCKGGGGVMIATKQEYDIQGIELEANISAETVWATISLKGQRKLVVGSYYRPPDSGSDSIDDLESVLSFITEKF